jgi:Regulator of chromosome condensation (RCC1) repeat
MLFAALGVFGVLGPAACDHAALVTDAPSLDAGPPTPDIDAGPPPPTLDAGGVAPGRVALRATAIAVGRYHVCALLEDQRLKCWGVNDFGQLGLGDALSRGVTGATMGDALPAVDLGTGRHATAIAAGHYATCALLDDGSVKCWGALPTGLPSRTAAPDFRGDEPGEMGDALPALDLGGHTATKIAVGHETGCALRDDGQLRCWLAGLTPVQAVLPASLRVVDIVGTWGVSVRFDDGSVREILDPRVASPPLALGVNRHATVVGNGNRNYCVEFVEDGVVCTEESLKVPPFGERGLQAISISEMYLACGLAVDGGDVSCWGGFNPIWGTTQADGSARVRLGQPATALAGGGYEHTCALLVDGSVKCWDSYDDVDAHLERMPDAPAWLGASYASISGPAWPPIALGTRAAP